MFKKTIKKIISCLCLFLGLSSCQSSNNPNIVSINADDFASKIEQMKKNNQEYMIIDIRTKPEFDSGHLEDAVMIDYYSNEFYNNISKLDNTKTYFVYCRSGNRSGKSLKLFHKAGFTKVYDLKGGINAWKADGKKKNQIIVS